VEEFEDTKGEIRIRKYVHDGIMLIRGEVWA